MLDSEVGYVLTETFSGLPQSLPTKIGRGSQMGA
jgi:hypothetical protein